MKSFKEHLNEESGSENMSPQQRKALLDITGAFEKAVELAHNYLPLAKYAAKDMSKDSPEFRRMSEGFETMLDTINAFTRYHKGMYQDIKSKVK